MRDQRLRNIDIKLFAFRQEYADHAIPAERLRAERGNDRAVLPAGDGNDCVAVLAVCLKPVTDPCDHIIFYFLCIKTHVCLSFFISPCFVYAVDRRSALFLSSALIIHLFPRTVHHKPQEPAPQKCGSTLFSFVALLHFFCFFAILSLVDWKGFHKLRQILKVFSFLCNLLRGSFELFM